MNEFENTVVIRGTASRKWAKAAKALSSILFSIILKYVIIRKSEINRSGLMYDKRHRCLAFADDIALVEKTKTKVQKVAKRLELEACTVRLEIN